MTMFRVGGYDHKGEIVAVVSAGSLSDAVACLLPHLMGADPGFEPYEGWLEVPSDRAGETHYAVPVGEDTQVRVLAERPSIGLPATHALTAGEVWHLPDVPEGTEVFVDGVKTKHPTAEQGLTLKRTRLGKSRIELEPPFPFKAATCELEIVAP